VHKNPGKINFFRPIGADIKKCKVPSYLFPPFSGPFFTPTLEEKGELPDKANKNIET
jgi:hypothetical protein